MIRTMNYKWVLVLIAVILLVGTVSASHTMVIYTNGSYTLDGGSRIISASSKDGMINDGSPVAAYATVRAANGDTAETVGNTMYIYVQANTTGTDTYNGLCRSAIELNTSPIPDDGLITTEAFTFYVQSKNVSMGTPSLGITAFIPATPGTIAITDYNNFDIANPTEYATQKAYADMTASNWYTINLNAAAIANTTKTSSGYLNFMLRDSWDISGDTTGMAAWIGGDKTIISIRTAEYDIYSPYVTFTYTIPPVAAFTNTTGIGNDPLEVTFTDTSTETPTSWDWYYSKDGGADTHFTDYDHQNPVETFTAGSYAIKLKATNAAGSDWENTSADYIVVSSADPPVASFTSSVLNGMNPLTVTFTDTSSPAGDTYLWSYKNETVTTWTVFPENSTVQNPVVTFYTGIYDINVTATNDAGSDTETVLNKIVVQNMTFPRLYSIRESYGYTHNTTTPWKEAQSDMLTNANTNALRDYTAPTGDASYINGIRAMNSAIAYNISRNTTYANQTVNALLNMWLDWDVTYGDTSQSDLIRGLQFYAFAFDQVANTLNTNTNLDNTNYSIIRDNLAIAANDSYENELIHLDWAADPNIFVPVAVGIAETAIVLDDYKNTSLSSISDGTFTNWTDAGYGEIFINDTHHRDDLSSPSVLYGNNGSLSISLNIYDGRWYEGSNYKDYVADDLYSWVNVYNYVYDENLFETFPFFKSYAMEHLWSALPNHYMPNTVASANVKNNYGLLAYGMLDDINRSQIMWHQNIQIGSSILPYTRYDNDLFTAGAKSREVYLFYNNSVTATPSPPTRKNSIDEEYTYQIIRGGWTNQSDWLQLVTWNKTNVMSNRATEHDDQLAFEYYSKGDLLMPDGGEPIYYTPEGGLYYGYDSVYHNVFMINNSYPRAVYATTHGSNVSERSMYKSDANNAYSTDDQRNSFVSYPTVIDNSNMVYVGASVTIQNITNNVTGRGNPGSVYVISPTIDYYRGVIYPLSDYMIVIDRAASTGSYGFTNLFRFGSLTTNASELNPATPSDLGNVKGTLKINGVTTDWLSVPYKVEIEPGLSTNNISWNTTNPYNDNVTLELYTSPSTIYTYQKYITRIGGYDGRNEVTLPHVYLKQPANKTLYRVTALLSRYDNETPKTPTELTVTGTGSAIKVVNSVTSTTDYIYTGSGNSTFDNFETDADTVFIRDFGTYTYTLIINGSSLKYGDQVLLSNATVQPYLEEGMGDELEHPPVADFYCNPLVGTTATSIVCNDTSTYSPSSWAWYNNTTSVGTTRNVTFTIATVGLNDIKLKATNGDGFDWENKTGYINITSATIAPVASFTKSRSIVKVPQLVIFNDTCTNTPETYSWSFGDLTANVTTQNATHSWSRSGYFTIGHTCTNSAGSSSAASTIWVQNPYFGG